MQKQTTTTKTNKQEQKVTLVDKVLEQVAKVAEKDKNVRKQQVTGYISIKYGNKVLFELHAKKKSISHLTFSSKQKAYDILKANKLIHRVVPSSYGWKYNTECFLDDTFIKFFPEILKSVVAEAIEERNLKTKKEEKKVKTA